MEHRTENRLWKEQYRYSNPKADILYIKKISIHKKKLDGHYAMQFFRL